MEEGCSLLCNPCSKCGHCSNCNSEEEEEFVDEELEEITKEEEGKWERDSPALKKWLSMCSWLKRYISLWLPFALALKMPSLSMGDTKCLILSVFECTQEVCSHWCASELAPFLRYNIVTPVTLTSYDPAPHFVSLTMANESTWEKLHKTTICARMCERELFEVDLELAAHIQLYIALRLQLIAVLMQSSRELHDRFLRLNDDMMYQLQNSCTFRTRPNWAR